MNEWGKRSDTRMQSRGKSTRKWRDVTVRDFLVHPEREGSLLKRQALGGRRELPRVRLNRSCLKDTLSEQTDVSCCPVRMGPWLEKLDPTGLGGHGGRIWPLAAGYPWAARAGSHLKG